MSHIDPAVVIRAARGSDGRALRRLAELDSRPVPRGELLVGEIDGKLVAAYAPESRAVIADPFTATADVVALLQLHGGRRRRGEHRIRRSLPRLRIA